MQIAVFCVTVDGEERFAAFCADAELRTIRGLEGPFTETVLRALLAQLEMGGTEMESKIALARAYPNGSATDH